MLCRSRTNRGYGATSLWTDGFTKSQEQEHRCTVTVTCKQDLNSHERCFIYASAAVLLCAVHIRATVSTTCSAALFAVHCQCKVYTLKEREIWSVVYRLLLICDFG